MKILLINSIAMYDQYEIHNGTLLIGTILRKANFDVEIVDFNYLCLSKQLKYKENVENGFVGFGDYLVSKNPDVIGFSTFANFYIEAVM